MIRQQQRIIDGGQIATFVGALFRYADEGGFVQLRAFRDDAGGTWKSASWPVIQINGAGLGPLVGSAAAWAQECADASVRVVFCPPIVTLTGGRTAGQEDIANGLVLSVECDERPVFARQCLEALLGPATMVIASGGLWIDPETGEAQEKVHLHWRLTEPTRELADHVKLKEARRLATILAGADASAVPLVHPMRWPGSWHRKGEPRLARIVALNEDAEIDLGEALERLREAVAARGEDASEADYTTHEPGDPEADPLDVAAALAVIPNADLPWDEWNRIGMATWAATAGSEDGFVAFAFWSAKSGKHDIAACRERWNHYRTSPPSLIGFGTLVFEARAACPGWHKPSDTANDWTVSPRSGDPFTDYGNGHRSTDDHEDWASYSSSGPRNNGQPSAALWEDDDNWTEADLPLRPWVARGYAMRGAVTVIAGPPSAMKSSLMLAWACAVALRHEHGQFQPAETGTVIVYNVEDDQTEQRRRLSAVLRQFDALPADIASKIIRTGPSGIGTLFERDERGAITSTPAMSRLRELIATRLPAILIADPLAELHNAEENDNTAIRSIIAAFRALAVEFNIAVVLIHHTRKGELVPGDPDSARGASAIIGAARIVKTLIGMSEQDAEALGLPKDRKTRSAYVRLDDAKQNYAGIGDAEWHEKTLCHLDNGEVVAAASPWSPPDVWKAITPSVANAILDDIEAGIDGGKRRYSDAPNAIDRSVTKVFAKHVPSLTDKQARVIIKTWIENGMLGRDNYDDPIDRKERSGLVVLKRPGRAS